MAKRQAYKRGRGGAALLKDKDWITVIGALMRDRSTESRRLAKELLLKTKQGRHIRLVRLIQSGSSRLAQLQKLVGVTRRTLFRDLNDLEAHGVGLTIGEDYRYRITRLPDRFKRLTSRVPV